MNLMATGNGTGNAAGSSFIARSGLLDASTFLTQAEQWLQPEGFNKFFHFYTAQIKQNDRYGCHCQLKDLVSQDYIDYQDGRDHYKYYGVPVDPLDRACHQHRECLRCAKMELGCASDGISEHYLDYSVNSVGYCSGSHGSCNRAYCECAQQFIIDIHDSAIYSYDQSQFSRIFGDFQASEETCPRSPDKNFGRSDSRRENNKRPISCCAKEASQSVGPWRLFNSDRHKCCDDGEVRLEC